VSHNKPLHTEPRAARFDEIKSVYRGPVTLVVRQQEFPHMDWKPNNEALRSQRESMIADVASDLDPADHAVAERIVDAFCQLTPPMERPPVIHMITLHSGGLQGGETTKPGNLRLNWNRFVRDCGDMVLTAAGVVAAPILIPFAALSLWNKYWTHATITLSREQATALFAMCDT